MRSADHISFSTGKALRTRVLNLCCVLGSLLVACAVSPASKAEQALDHKAAKAPLQHTFKVGSVHGFRGSVPIKVNRTVHTQRWATLLNEDAQRYFLGSCEQTFCKTPLFSALMYEVRRVQALPVVERLRAVNAMVNHSVRYTSDEQRYRKPDHWAMVSETLAAGSGDCEDLAILKMWLLRALDVSPADMDLLLVRDQRRGFAHAVLVVRVDAQKWVLDVRGNRVLRENQSDGYIPVISLGSAGVWIHGVRTSDKVS